MNTLSKLTYGDTDKFLSLIGDVFPGSKSSDISGGQLEEAIKEVKLLNCGYVIRSFIQ